MSPKTVIKKFIPKKLFRHVAPYWHWLNAVRAQKMYGFPARDLNIIGVTGTDGKTTVSTLIAHMLRTNGYKVGLMTTVSVDYADGKGEHVNPTNLTTGNAYQVAQIMRKIKNNRADWLVLETSSHALDQRRVWGIPFAIAVHTNMSPEHLDYHGTFENYRTAKQRLFKLCNNNTQGLRTGIINADDATAEYFASDIDNPILYGIKKGTLKATNIKSGLHGNTFDVAYDGQTYHIHTNLIGEFNIYNSLAALGVGISVGLSPKQIEKGIDSLKHISGRMMPLDEGQNFKVFIDYAVTPGALKHVLESVRSLISTGTIHLVFGATGDRDTLKRPVMGKIAGELADYVYLTDDETYTEDPSAIRKAVYEGVGKKDQHKVQIIEDRREAIRLALAHAKSGDVVLITGIGHQTSRNMGGKKQSWSDIKVTKTLLKATK
jgi:UDP-N-acetylmuramoyl-L-alanyl-D-glutamate--2,6-diaminopimelate ligase